MSKPAERDRLGYTSNRRWAWGHQQEGDGIGTTAGGVGNGHTSGERWA